MERRIFIGKKFTLGSCACGCKTEIPIRNKLRKLQRFKNGHNAYLRIGPNNPNWIGGRCKDHGYVNTMVKGHHFADKNGYVLEHRYVWEQYNKAVLLPWADVHHINHIKTDNRIQNLRAMMHKYHAPFHTKKDMSNRVCYLCKSKTTFLCKQGYFVWRRRDGNWYCFTCHNKTRDRRKIKVLG